MPIEKFPSLKFPAITINALSILLWILILFGSYERLICAFQTSPLNCLISDPGRHWSYGLAAFTENPLTAFDNIGYQIWLAAITRITSNDPLAVCLYTSILSIITPWIWYRFFREIVSSKEIALLGWAIIAWLPSWIGIYSYFMTETLFLPLLGLALWFSWRSVRRKTLESFVWAIIFWFMAILVRPVAVPMLAFCLVWLLSIHNRKKQKLIVTCLLALCFFLPISYRNYRVMGVFSPLPYKPFDIIHMISGKKWINMDLIGKDSIHYRYRFLSASTSIEPFAPFSHWRSSRSPDSVNISANLNHGTKDWFSQFKNNWPGFHTFFKMWLENIIFLLFGPSWPDFNPQHFWENLATQMRWLWAPLLAFISIADILYFKKHKQFAALPALTLFTCLIVLLLPYVPCEGRYRKPLEGLLIANMLWLIPPKKLGNNNKSAIDNNSGC